MFKLLRLLRLLRLLGWKIHFLLSVCFCGPVNYGEPDSADDDDPSVHKIRDDTIHNEDIPHSSSSTGAFCVFSVQIRCHAFLSMFLVVRHVLVRGTCAGGEARRKILNARAAKTFRILSLLSVFRLLKFLRLLSSVFGSRIGWQPSHGFLLHWPLLCYGMPCRKG